MKRILALTLALFSLLLLPTSEKSSAQTAADKQQKEMPAPEFKKLKDGVQVLRLWESIGPKWPQIAILRLSVDEYGSFRKDPVGYLNDNQVYPPEYPAKKFDGCELSHVHEKDGRKLGNECIVMLRHDITSTSVGTSSCNVEE
ncbi:MAG: hypothetical protein WA789_17220 [Candidatus Acidiferrum sp.]